MASILVTGGCGFIGGAFVRKLLRESDLQVVNLDRLTYAGNLDSLAEVADNPRHVFIQADIGDASRVAAVLAEHRPEKIVNFAAESHVDRSIGSPGSFVQTNVVGTCELLMASLQYWERLGEAEKKEFRFLHVSTDEVYGSLGPSGKFTEVTAYAPNSPYSASKAASDHFVRAFHHTYGLPVVTTNCSNNYGPYQFPEKLIPLMILNALEGKHLPVYGDGGNIRDWLYVEDHCQALAAVLARGRVGEVYNIGGNCERTNLDIVKLICHSVDRLRPGLHHQPSSSLIRFVTDRPGHDRRYAIDSSKIERELDWRPRMSFEEGIERTVRWYLDNTEWVDRVTSGKYRRERLGLRRQAPAEPGRETAADRRPSMPERFREGLIEGVVFTPLSRRCDQRGWLCELYREDELDRERRPVMAYVSETQPGVVRGPHEHLDQTDYFAFIGPGDFDLYLWDARPGSPTAGCKSRTRCGESAPQSVQIPPGVVHAYKNVSDRPGWVFNAANRLYAGWRRREPVDEIRHEDREGSPFRIGDF